MIVLLLILRLATILNTGFEQMFLQRNAVGAQAAEVLDTFTYFRGIQGGDWGFSAAVGLVKGVFAAVLVFSRQQGGQSARRRGGVLMAIQAGTMPMSGRHARAAHRGWSSPARWHAYAPRPR